jgi:exonuclease SbcD
MATDAAGHSGAYAEHLKVLAGDLARAAHRKDEVNLLAAHLMVSGAALGGGERPAHTIMPYALGAGDLPDDLHYVALGHLHRQQRLGGSAEVPKWYAGSPLQLDFGEEEDRKAVLVVDASAGRPAAVRSVPLDGGRALRTVRGSMLQLRALAGDVGDAWLRVEVDEPAHAGLADEVREILPNAVQVTPRASEAAPGRERVARLGRSPDELFTEYLAEHDVDDPRLVTLFRELHDQLDEADDAA